MKVPSILSPIKHAQSANASPNKGNKKNVKHVKIRTCSEGPDNRGRVNRHVIGRDHPDYERELRRPASVKVKLFSESVAKTLFKYRVF